MMLSGTVIGFICVFALLAASVFLAFLDWKEKGKGNADKSRRLSRMALGLFLAAFFGGVGVTLIGGVKPRAPGEGVTGGMSGSSPAPMTGIGRVDPKEIEALKANIEKNPKDVASMERLGHLYLQQQDFNDVVEMSRRALDVDPKSVESRVHIAMVLFAMQKPDDALRQFDQALAVDPKNLEALLFKGIVQFQGKDDIKGAKETWEKFMKLSKPGDTGRERVAMFLQNIDSLLSQQKGNKEK